MVDRNIVGLGLFVAGMLLVGGCHSGHSTTQRATAKPPGMTASDLTGDRGLAIARNDPLSFLIGCRDHYLTNVRDYRCRFIKEERINGVLGAEQQMEAVVREEPFSVSMRWIKNPGLARRVSYVAGRWQKDGHELMHIDLHGILGLMTPAGVRRSIDGKRAMETSRRPINRFGFKNTLDAVIRSCASSEGAATCQLKFVGEEELEGRASLVFERRCAIGENSTVDALLVVLIDREWLLPTGSIAYADENRETLLGRYTLTDVVVNAGLTDADFE